MLCVPALSRFAHDLGAFGAIAMRFVYLKLEAAMTEFTIIFFVCFNQAKSTAQSISFCWLPFERWLRMVVIARMKG